MRLACCGSSLRSSRPASVENSILQAMTLYNVFEGDSGRFATADAVQRTLGKIDVLEILQVPEDRLAGIEGFGAAGALGESFQALFNGFRKADGQHGTSLYKYSTA